MVQNFKNISIWKMFRKKVLILKVWKNIKENKREKYEKKEKTEKTKIKTGKRKKKKKGKKKTTENVKKMGRPMSCDNACEAELCYAGKKWKRRKNETEKITVLNVPAQLNSLCGRVGTRARRGRDIAPASTSDLRRVFLLWLRTPASGPSLVQGKKGDAPGPSPMWGPNVEHV